MKNKFRTFFGKVFYVAIANVIGLLISLLNTLLVPKFFGNNVVQYGYLEIYLFYVSYIGFFQLGWCDGIFLRDGGKLYDELDKRIYSSQFRLLFLIETIVAVLISSAGFLLFGKDTQYRFIAIMFSLNLIICIPGSMLNFILQTTSRIKEYAWLATIKKVLYGISIVLIVILLTKDYKWFVYADLLSKLITTCISIWFCRDIVFKKPSAVHTAFCEAKKNISVGIKLMFANIASMLITGIARWGIQIQWDVATYGKISFTLSVCNILLLFINAVAIVLYPTLRRTDKHKLATLYNGARDIMMFFMFGGLLLYYPIKSILSLWLPQYKDSLDYMAVLFPMCIYSAKMSMLIQTYMNTYRLEKQMLNVNLVGIGVAIVTTLFSAFILRNLTLTMVAIVINTVFRCICAEIVLMKYVDIHPAKDIIYELVLTIIFIITQWYIKGILGLLAYAICFFIYFLLKKKAVIGTFKKLITKSGV